MDYNGQQVVDNLQKIVGIPLKYLPKSIGGIFESRIVWDTERPDHGEVDLAKLQAAERNGLFTFAHTKHLGFVTSVTISNWNAQLIEQQIHLEKECNKPASNVVRLRNNEQKSNLQEARPGGRIR